MSEPSWMKMKMSQFPPLASYTTNLQVKHHHEPIASMGLVRIFTYVYHKDQPNVGNNTIHGWYGWCNKSSSILESSKGKRVDKPGTARKPMTFHPWEEWREQFFLCGLGKKIPWNVWRMWRTYRNFFKKNNKNDLVSKTEKTETAAALWVLDFRELGVLAAITYPMTRL